MAAKKQINHFEDILDKGARQGKIPNRTQDARDWYRNQAKLIGRIRNERMVHESRKERWTTQPSLGHMYMVFYDAKWKEELPYWDKFPLVIPFKYTENGFYGLNFHYLPLPMRAALMDQLYGYVSDQYYNDKTKFNFNYDILERYSENKFYKPCIKRYLWTHFRSPFMHVVPPEWDIALFMPVERFQKKTKTQVWADTKRKLK